MNKPEILAPAGGHEQLISAVRSSADAVYLGLDRFSARSSAENFTPESLKEAVSYAHARNVKVYAAINTLITDDEYLDAKNAVKAIAEAGVDGVIVQDFAIAEIVKKHCPELRLHASTQTAVHNVMGLEALKKLGFVRAVAPRELTKDEIKTLCEVPNIETEIFVHGALCMSVSGMCYLSSMLGGRSGNRGRCAQPCRLDFKCHNRTHALSLKDSSLIEYIPELEKIGVTSLKIEGRMKRPEYVAAAVNSCKKSRDGLSYDSESLRSVFSRSGFTDGYYTGRRNLDMFGYRLKDDVTAAKDVLSSLAFLYKDEIQSVGISVDFHADKNSSFVTVSDGVNSVRINGDVPEEAKSKPLDYDFAKKCFSKTGGTIFYINSFNADIADGISLSASSLNSMRRRALDSLYEKRAVLTPKKFYDPPADNETEQPRIVSSGDKKIRMRFTSAEQIFNLKLHDDIILPLNEILKNPNIIKDYSGSVFAETPALIYPSDEEKVKEKLARLKALGINDVYCDNIGIIDYCISENFRVHASNYTNILNSAAAKVYADMGVSDIVVSAELSMDNIKKLTSSIPKGAFAYGFMPLMRFRTCPAQTNDGCSKCTGLTKIEDRYKTPFYIMCSYKKYSSLLNSIPTYIGDKDLSALDFSLLYFTFEKKETCEKIYKLFKNGEKLPSKKTGGLYYRQIL